MTQQNSKSLIESAGGQDGLSANTVGILINNLNPVTLAGAAGTSLSSLGSEATLYVRVIDRTGSMKRHAPIVIQAANDQLDALAGSKAADSILMSTFLFNTSSTVLHSYLPLDKAVRLDDSNYQPNDQTALYDAVLNAITSMVSYVQSLLDTGMTLKVVMVVISDGEDNYSKHSVSEVKSVIADLINQEIYTFAFVAFGSEAHGIADAMGIPAKNVIESSADAHSIRVGFEEVSKSVIRASQSIVGATGNSFFN